MNPGFLLKVIHWLEMDAHGVITGFAGAMLSLFVLNGNAFTWRRTFMTLFAGIVVCGYSMPWIESKLIAPGDERSLALLANILAGFILSDLLSSIKTAAPTITNFLVQRFLEFGKRFFRDKTDENGK